ncbi:MAG: GIY-YIG nuclease family protein [Acidobacteriaceae bacterium]
MNKRDHDYYVYIVASRTHVLYCGVTKNIRRRVEEHREAVIPGFTEVYQCNRLVWFERYQYILHAIEREKQIKRWRREKKIWLIEETNPTWADLSEAWRKETAGPSATLRCAPVGMTRVKTAYSWGHSWRAAQSLRRWTVPTPLRHLSPCAEGIGSRMDDLLRISATDPNGTPALPLVIPTGAERPAPNVRLQP